MDIKQTREEIQKRSRVLKERQRKRTKVALQTMSVFLTAMLVLVIKQVSILPDATMQSEYYGTLMLGNEFGVYIIVGLICFLLGVVITIYALKFRNHNQSDDSKGDES